MARITSKVALIAYAKQQLGYPLINVEVSDDQIAQIIDDTIQLFTEYAYGELHGALCMEIGSAGDYIMPNDITNITKVSRGGGFNFMTGFGGMVPIVYSDMFFSTMSNSGSGGGANGIGAMVGAMSRFSSTAAMLDKYMGNDFNYNFNYNKKILQVFEDVNDQCLIYYMREYLANDEDDFIFNHEFIKAYVVSKTKFMWGTVTGKFDSALVGGARINYSDMKSEATSEIDVLKRELLDRWTDPCPIDIA